MFSACFAFCFLVCCACGGCFRSAAMLKCIPLYPYTAFLCTVRMLLSRVYTPLCQFMFIYDGRPLCFQCVSPFISLFLCGCGFGGCFRSAAHYVQIYLSVSIFNSLRTVRMYLSRVYTPASQFMFIYDGSQLCFQCV